MQLQELQPTKPRKTAKRIGRGGKRGKTSGRGHKGQKARAGNSSRPEMRDQIKRLPKRRGYGTNRARTVNADKVKPKVINLSALEELSVKAISPKELVRLGAVTRRRRRVPTIKILGNGKITKPVNVTGCLVSAAARAKIEKAGGSVKD